MRVLSFSFENYRNLKPGALKADESTNIICGQNAQGKTNLLEAVWLFTGGRSFSGARDQELVSMENPHAPCTLRMRFESGGREQERVLTLTGGRRHAEKNGVALKTPGELIGAFCAVLFSPDHLSLVKEGPAVRRAFLDAALCQIRPAYAKILSQYTRTLQQRGALLKDIPYHGELMDLLEVWDERLIRLGARIQFERARYTAALQRQAVPVYEGISSGRETLEIAYQSTVAPDSSDLTQPQWEQCFWEKLRAARREDLLTGSTGVGPHRDELMLSVNGLLARSFGSQGQQRSVVLALKLGEANVMAQSIGEEPVILLDDVLSELDDSRQEYLLNHMKERQVFFTCCDPSGIRLLRDGKVFYMKEGCLTGAPL